MLTVKQRLAVRDGNECWYCATPLLGKSSSLEHLRALSNGGDGRFSNLRLACGFCNTNVAALPVEVKLALREIARREASPTRARARLQKEVERLKRIGMRVCEQKPFRKVKVGSVEERKLEEALRTWGVEERGEEQKS